MTTADTDSTATGPRPGRRGAASPRPGMGTPAPGPTPFGSASTAAEVVAGVDLAGRRAIITGGASGIGAQTARALAGAGASVTLAVRDTTAGQEAAAQLRARTGSHDITVAPLDLADLSSVAAFTAAWRGPLHILIGNAGVMAVQELTRTSRGPELQFATNHLGHFALATGLHDALAAGNARIVSVSSSGHQRSPVVFDDLDYRFRDYDPFGAYGQSKTANILFAVEATRRWAADGITANALHPDGIATRLQRHVGGAAYMRQAAERFRQAATALKTAEQGAATSALLAASPLLEGIGGRYFEDCNQAPVIHARGAAGLGGVADYALDPGNAARLWDVSLTLTS
jgi:NAD(P)-dependent dehydrogenase (short-subunit alcohol dehydrogenase family)